VTTFEQARDRVEHRLTYDRCEPREFYQDSMDGPSIPDALGDGTSSGEWFGGDRLAEDADEEERLAHFAYMAVNEAIHEALEWFKVDGRPWLDPHGDMERNIYRATERLCKSLAAMRATSLRRGSQGEEQTWATSPKR